MSRTPHSSLNQQFTDASHQVAIRLLYPDFFGVCLSGIAYSQCSASSSDERSSRLDGEEGTDYEAYVHHPAFRAPFPHAIQERFSRLKWAHFDHITLTEWNPLSDQPSELYKIRAGLFSYGYGNAVEPDQVTGLLNGVIVAVAPLLRALPRMRIDRRTNPRTGQPFVRITYDELDRHGLILFRYSSLPAESR